MSTIVQTISNIFTSHDLAIFQQHAKGSEKKKNAHLKNKYHIYIWYMAELWY